MNRFFPHAICSRLATGYPVLFNYLRVNELERVVQSELARIAGLFERRYFKKLAFHELLPISLVLREGARADARTLRSQADVFVKTEVFKFCQLFKTERLEDVLQEVDQICFALDAKREALDADIRALFEQQGPARVLLVAEADLTALYREFVPQIEWRTAHSAEEALEVLADQEVDMVLLDLWVGGASDAASASVTMAHFDHVPATARGLDKGQELLRRIRERLPAMPVYLLSLAESEGAADGQGSIDDELFGACVRGGGARGMIVSRFIDGMVSGWETHRDQLTRTLEETCRRLYRERAAERMGHERKVLAFDTAPWVDRERRTVNIRLRNLNLARAVAAADAGEVLDEVERPRTLFEDVIGADTAKDELGFFIDYLKNPRRFAALGLKPPKGVLLYGPPGTGKTMLARAMAGESNVAFIPAAASSFVTIWQGSGPQSVRDLFDRARRYAPAIIFIDEIDAIGKVRSGSPGAGRAEEMALNALLTEMDGFTSVSAERPVFVLAATNFKVQTEDQDYPEHSARTLDPALVRRFSRTILVDLPDTSARREYLAMRLGQAKGPTVSQSAIDLMAEKSVGMTIADLEQVIETAVRTALRMGTEMSDDLLLEALDTSREGEAKEWSLEFLQSTARHEAGHTIMYWLSGWWSPEVSIIARADRGGGMRPCEQEVKRESLNREQMLARIRTSLGGRAAELLYDGAAGLTTGAAGDLKYATGVVRKMICLYGMEEEFGLLSMPELLQHAEAISSPDYKRINDLAGEILKAEMAKTQERLQANRQHLDAVATALLDRNRLYRKDLEDILPAVRDALIVD